MLGALPHSLMTAEYSKEWLYHNFLNYSLLMDNSAMYCYFSITHNDTVNICGKCFFEDTEQYFSLTHAWRQNAGFDTMHILYLADSAKLLFKVVATSRRGPISPYLQQH